MAIPYHQALNVLANVAEGFSQQLEDDEDVVPITAAVGRICKLDYRSSHSTPPYDTSAMDGFAVCSEMTQKASIAHPLKFRNCGIIAAGERPVSLACTSEDCPPCVEIMTGAPFPISTSALQFDCCVRVEDTKSVVGPDGNTYVEIVRPVLLFQNRRFAGTDFQRNGLVISKGSTVRPPHVMALASLGISRIAVYRRLRIAILSTGSELLSFEADSHDKSQIRDSNGPYIQASLGELGTDAKYLGIMADDQQKFEDTVRRTLTTVSYDLFITTGAVSMGKFDFVRNGLTSLGADILFHKVAIRPGHPVLFATLSLERAGLDGSHVSAKTHLNLPMSSVDRTRKTAFFGLPGNPMATAASLRFLVAPYIRYLHSQPLESPSFLPLAAVKLSSQSTRGPMACETAMEPIITKPSHLRAFWHGRVKSSPSGATIEVHPDQGSSKVRPLLSGDCWIIGPEGCEQVRTGDIIESFPLQPPSLGAIG